MIRVAAAQSNDPLAPTGARLAARAAVSAGDLRADRRPRAAGRKPGAAVVGRRPTGAARGVRRRDVCRRRRRAAAAAPLAAGGRRARGHPRAARVWRLQQRLRHAGPAVGRARHCHIRLRPARVWRCPWARALGRRGAARRRHDPCVAHPASDVSRAAALSPRREHGGRGGDRRDNRSGRAAGGRCRRGDPQRAGGVGVDDDGFSAAPRALCRGPPLS